MDVSEGKELLVWHSPFAGTIRFDLELLLDWVRALFAVREVAVMASFLAVGTVQVEGLKSFILCTVGDGLRMNQYLKREIFVMRVRVLLIR
jgi:hypothetical protein